MMNTTENGTVFRQRDATATGGKANRIPDKALQLETLSQNVADSSRRIADAVTPPTYNAEDGNVLFLSTKL